MLFVHKSLFVTLCQTPTLTLVRPRREYSRVSRYRKDLAELETAKPSLLVWEVNIDAVTLQMLKLGADGVRFICPSGRNYPHVDANSGRADCACRASSRKPCTRSSMISTGSGRKSPVWPAAIAISPSDRMLTPNGKKVPCFVSIC